MIAMIIHDFDMNFIEEKIKEALYHAGVQGDIIFSQPPKPEMGDLAFACFDLAKKEGKNPVEIARELAGRIVETRLIASVQAFGPYVNFYLNAGEVAKLVICEVNKKNYGASDFGKRKKMMIEYPSQNTHKEFHIGHLRNVCIGNTLMQLYKKSGYKIVPVNYINDFGAHVVKCLWWIMRKGRDALQCVCTENRQRWLGEMYAEASNYIKEHTVETQNLASLQIKSELDELQKKLEKKDHETMKLFKETRKWSLDGFKKIDKELGLKYKEIFLESDVKDGGQKIVDELLAKKIAQVGERGAIIIDLTQCGLDIALIRKSTGAGVYLTSDFGLAIKKFKKYKVDESINITGSEQDFYFKQLFKVLELYGFKHKMSHIGYGLVNLPSGKMSSRAGNVILYDDLRDEVFARMLAEAQTRHTDWSKKKMEKTALVLTMAILKFTMQKHEANKVITFDLKEAVSFEGFSAPYLLYVVARINSLLRKSKVHKVCKVHKVLAKLATSEEKKLLMLIGEYGEVVKKAMENKNPSVIAKYCFDLAQAFNDFYNKHSVLSAENKELTLARLALCGAVKKVLVDALGLLTIDVVEEM